MIPSVNLIIPEGFLCPITHEIMCDPLMCRSGLSFERAAIISWLYHHNNACPITRQSLSPRDLVKNTALRLKIRSWCLENGVELKDDDRGQIILTCPVSSLKEIRRKSRKRSAVNRSRPCIRFNLLRQFRPNQ